MTPAEVVNRLGSGDFIDNLTAALKAVADDVIITGSKGAVTVTFEIQQTAPGEPAVVIKDTLQRKPPKEAGRGMVAYVDETELLQRDPRQPDLPFRTIEGDGGKVREPAETAGQVRGVAE